MTRTCSGSRGCFREAGFDETAEKLEDGYDLETKVLALRITEREEILRTLDDAPNGLAELRGVLLREHEWRCDGSSIRGVDVVVI